MLTLLKIRVSGYRMLDNDFEIDFVSRARAESDENDSSEIFEVAEGLHVFNVIALTGSNSSGKSTVLSLIHKVLLFMKTGRWKYRKNDFSSAALKLHIEFFLNGTVYLYDSTILPLQMDSGLEIGTPYCTIKEELLRYAEYKASVSKRYADSLKFEADLNATGLDDTSKLVFLCKDHINGDFLKPFFNNGLIVNERFFDCLQYFDRSLTLEIIRLLDDSIEVLHYAGKDSVEFKRFGEPLTNISKTELLSLLSNGTIKGIELYIRTVTLLKHGGILLIDEIENCFHKNLVNNILFLLTDKTINRKNAQLVFSTHYVEILDVLNRRDNIFILHKTNSKIKMQNLYSDYGIRTELSKSKRFNNNAFGTLLNYERLMKVKGLIRREILNYD